MFAILSVGFLGNALTVIILRRHEHASKSLTPLMINLSVGSLIIIVLGYPVVLSILLKGGHVRKEEATCTWSAFINGTVGMFLYVTVRIAAVRPSKGLYVVYFGHHFENRKDRFVVKNA